MQVKMEICQCLPLRLIKKRRAAKFESLRLTAFYQALSLESYVMLLKITWSGLNRNFVRLFFFYPGRFERSMLHITEPDNTNVWR